MSRSRRKFPLVADGVPVVDEPKIMNLYENEDLIHNIHGDYQERNYSDLYQSPQVAEASTESTQLNSSHKLARDLASYIPKRPERKSYSEKAREEAKRDVRKKRQSYVASDVKTANRGGFEVGHSQKPTTRPVERPKTNSSLTRFSEKLHQDNYILADIKPEYKIPDSSSANQKPKKNNYDFLKTSQIYNRPDTRRERERQVAQELNLTRIDDIE